MDINLRNTHVRFKSYFKTSLFSMRNIVWNPGLIARLHDLAIVG